MGSAEFQTNDTTLIQTIKDSVEVQRFIPQPNEVFSHKLHFPPEKPLVQPVALASLTGVIDYLKHNIDQETRQGIFVTVDAPNIVSVSHVVKHREDRRFVAVVSMFPAIENVLLDEEQVDHQDAIICLQSCFASTDAQRNLIRQLAQIVVDESIERTDDGLSQEFVTRAAISAKGERIENPVLLRPFRTFAEIEQPETPFIVRLEKSRGIQVGLFEADGGAWKNTARVAIKKYLENALAEFTADGNSPIPILA